jgi:hypothetical protein
MDNIVKYLEKNKFKLSKERKIEILSIWFYWLSGTNHRIWVMFEDIYGKNSRIISHKIGWFKILQQVASSVLYEAEIFGCCYNFKYEHEYDPDLMSSVYEEMVYQPDILTRAICSQYSGNYETLVKNGIKLKDIKYNHAQLKSPLHWAYYCNSFSTFNYLLENGCEIDLNDDIFYNKEHKKNLKFALFFYLFKGKIKYKDGYLYEKLGFGESDCLCAELKLYEHFSEEQIIEIFEQLTNIGFDINQTNMIAYSSIRWSKYKFSQYDTFKCSQLLTCICQTGITPKLIKYFVHKYLQENTQERLQDELVKVFIHAIIFSQSVDIIIFNKIKIIDFINIWNTLMSLIRKENFLKFRQLYIQEKEYIMYLHSFFYKPSFSKRLIKDEQEFPSCFFETKGFKFLNIFITNGLFDCIDSKELIKMILFHSFIAFRRDFDFDRNLKAVCCLILFFIKHDFLKANEIVEIIHESKAEHMGQVQRFGLNDKIHFIEAKLIKIFNSKDNNIKTLFGLSKIKSKKLFEDLAYDEKSEILNELRLPTHVKSIILNTKKFSQAEFNKLLIDKELN